MKTIETDVAVVGAGTAGLSAYKAAVKAGKRVLMIEGGPTAPPAHGWVVCLRSC